MLNNLVSALNAALKVYSVLLSDFNNYDKSILDDFIDYYGDTFQIKGWKGKNSAAEGYFTIDPLFMANNVDIFSKCLESRKWQLNDIINIVPEGYKEKNSNIVTSEGKKINDKRFISVIQEFKDANYMFFKTLGDLAQKLAIVNLNIEALPDVVDFNEDIFHTETTDIFVIELIKSVKGRLSNKLRFAKVDEIVNLISQNYKTQITEILNATSKDSVQQFKNKIYNLILNIKDDVVENDLHISRNIIDDIMRAVLGPKFLVTLDLSNLSAVLKKAKHITSTVNVNLDDIIVRPDLPGYSADLEYLAIMVSRLDFKYPVSAFRKLFEKYIEFNPNSRLLENPLFIASWLILNNKSIILDVFEASVSTLLTIIKRILNEVIQEVGDRIAKLISPF